uniref:USP8 dimerisation domain-containing protein n=1 Tax=Pseudo-nitzschia australis TaxID=44445 RepID=A0A7S4AB45_9STRA
MALNDDSPSAERRKFLKEADSASGLRILESFPLSKYIDIADRLLERFQNALDGRRLDEAYIFGLRFANICLSSLPQHPEWRRDTSSKARKQLTSQVGDVLCMMDVIKQRMDAEELAKMKQEIIAKEEEKARKNEEKNREKREMDKSRRREQQKRDALEKERAQFLAEQRSQIQEPIEQKQAIGIKKDGITKKKEIEQSAMAKLKAMQAQTVKHTDESQNKEERSTVASKKTAAKPKDAKTNERKLKNWLSGGKNKSSKITNDENIGSSPPFGTKDGAKMILLTTGVAEEKATIPKYAPEVTAEEHIRPQDLQLLHPQGETMAKFTINATDEEKRKNAIESPSDTISDTRTVKSTKGDTSVKPIRSKKIALLGSSVKSKIKGSINAVKPNKKTVSTITNKNKKTVSTITNKNNRNEKQQQLAKSKEIPSQQHEQKSSGDKPISLASYAGSMTKNDICSTAATIIAAQQAPRSRKEKATIDKLKRAISVQEDRLEEIEGKQIPFLLQSAKEFLKEKDKQGALKCLTHKKRLERQVDAVKAAVFNMETQMFMLESAFEDRHVKKALNEAANAIAGYQQNIGDPNAVMVDLTNMSASISELEAGDATDEELMEELSEWLSPEEKKKANANKDAYANDDDISLLTMPNFLPTVPVAMPISPSVDRILHAVLGS